MANPKSEADKRRDRSNRLKRLYGITVEEYEDRLRQQGGVCQICQRPPITITLSVDHDHKGKYLKLQVDTFEILDKFVATVKDSRVTSGSPYCQLSGIGHTKNEAKAALRERLKRASIRGLLCVSCNLGLRKFRDSPEFLRRAAEYLNRHQGR